MSIYRVEKKSKLPVFVAIALVAVAVVVIMASFGVFGKKELTQAEKKQQAVQELRMIAQGTEIFAISHYTKDIVENGEVKLPKEYSAALDSIEQLKKRFKKAQRFFSNKGLINKISTYFDEIIEAAKQKKDPKEVDKLVQELQTDLNELSRD